MRVVLLVSVSLVLWGCDAGGVPKNTKTSAGIAQPPSGPLADNQPVQPITRADPPGELAPGTSEKEEAATNPYEAFKWRRLAWLDEHGQIAPGALERALAQRAANLAYWAQQAPPGPRGADTLNWVERGPDNVGGRTRSLLIDPLHPSRMWGGSVSGGIWRSEDGGASWVQYSDWLPNLAIGCLAMAPSNPNIMYAGTGEGFFNGDAIGGTGIYKSEDGGTTWTLLPSTAGWDNVCRIAVSPTSYKAVLAARRYGGIYRSLDGGATWSNPRWAQGSYYVAFDPTNGTKAIAHIIDYDWTAGNWFHAALYSTNAGQSWTTAGGLSKVWNFDSRIELAYAPSNPSIAYASCAANGGKIWRSTDGGHSYTLRTTSGASGVNWYANPLWVDPTNPDVLLTGGGHIFRSLDGGVTLTQISNGYILTEQPHPDIHYFTHDPGYNGTTNRRVYVTTDGGIHRTDDIYTASTTSGWVSLQDTYRTTQFYAAAGDGPSGRIYGGTQDNGTLRLVPGSNHANLPFGGDGGFCAIDPTNANYCYGEYITLQIHRSTNGGVSAGYIYSGIADAGTNANFIAPFVLDLNNPQRLYAGGASLWRSTNVRNSFPTWQAIRPPGTDLISAVAVAKSNSNVVWVGQNNGEVYRTANALGSNPDWVVVDNNGTQNPLPNRYVTRILIDPTDENTVYVSVGGFSPDNLWKTTDAGITWQDLTGSGQTGLPSAPIRGLARHPRRRAGLYVGTEVGIFLTSDGGANWSTTNRGPANVSVDELTFMHNSSTLLAATHGRGLFTADIVPAVGDLNCDGLVDFADVDPFVLALTDHAAYEAQYPGCDWLAADCNHDGAVNLADIDPFVALLGG